MKFKEYLNINEYIKHDKTTKEWILIVKGFIPIRPNVLDSVHVPFSYHVTDFKGYKKLLKYQNQKKQIPVFTVGAEWLASGPLTSGGILVELEGETVFESPGDIGSALSRNGYRWIEPHLGMNYIKELKKDILLEVAKQLGLSIDRKHTLALGTFDEMYDIVKNYTGKEKASFIKWYFDMIPKYLNKTSINKIVDDINSVLIRYNKSGGSNELFLHNFTVTRLWRIEGKNMIDEITQQKNYSGVIHPSDLNKIKNTRLR